MRTGYAAIVGHLVIAPDCIRATSRGHVRVLGARGAPHGRPDRLSRTLRCQQRHRLDLRPECLSGMNAQLIEGVAGDSRQQALITDAQGQQHLRV